MEHEHIIGLLWQQDYADLITLNRLKEMHSADVELYEQFKDSLPHSLFIKEPKPLADYLDLRKSLLHHFIHCPECGKKIDWKQLRQTARESEASE